MPYVPSLKTDGKSQDRVLLDAAVEVAAREAATVITNNYSLTPAHKHVFVSVSKWITQLEQGKPTTVPVIGENGMFALAKTVYETGAAYGYEGAFLGELNYALTRFIQRVPQLKVADGAWLPKDEIRYWLYAATIGALLSAEEEVRTLDANIAGVLHDIKDEYKWRVNRSYEIAQIKKSGDCYDTPFYSRGVEVVDESGAHIGDTEVYLARSPETLGVDMLPYVLVLKKKT